MGLSNTASQMIPKLPSYYKAVFFLINTLDTSSRAVESSSS